MRVSSSVALLASAIVVLSARGSEAAPFVLGPTGQIAGSSCAAVGVVAGGADCGLFTVNPFSPTPIVGGFGFDNDVALFMFTLQSASTFSAFTTGFATTQFDPMLGLFYAVDTTVGGAVIPRGTIVEVPDPLNPGATIPIKGRDVNPDPSAPNYDDVLPDPDVLPTLTLMAGSYVLAMIQYPNAFHLGSGNVDSLAGGFDLDDPSFQNVNGGCVGTNRCNFSLTISATAVATVPEPSSFGLLALGVVTLGIVRRRVHVRSKNP